MKRRPPGGEFQIVTVKGLRLFLEDLEMIIEVLRRASLEVTLTDPDYEFENLEEVVQLRGIHPTKLTITGKGPTYLDGVTIEFEGARAYVHQYHAEYAGLASQVKDLLRGRRRWHSWLFRPIIWFICLNLFFWTAIVAVLLTGSSRNLRTIGVLLLIDGILLATTLFSVVASKVWYGPLLRRRHAGGFFKRNADQLLSAFIGALVGAALTVVFQRLFGAK